MTPPGEGQAADRDRPLLDEVRRTRLYDRCDDDDDARIDRCSGRLSDRSVLWHGLCAAAMALAASSVSAPFALFTAFLVGFNGLLAAALVRPLRRLFRGRVTSPRRAVAALCRFRRLCRFRLLRRGTGARSSPSPPSPRPIDRDAAAAAPGPCSNGRSCQDHHHERHYCTDNDDDDGSSGGPPVPRRRRVVDGQLLATAVRHAVRALLRRVDDAAAQWARSREHHYHHRSGRDRVRRRAAAAAASNRSPRHHR